MSPAAKLTVPLSVSVVYVLAARRRPDRHRVAGAERHAAPWFTVRPPEKHDRDAGGDGHGPPLVDGEAAGEDVAEVGRGLRADGVQRQRLAADDRVRLDVDALEPQVVAGRRYWTSMAGMYSGESKPSPIRSPALYTTPSTR